MAWELVESDIEGESFERIAVTGGWLYRQTWRNPERLVDILATSTEFVADPPLNSAVPGT